MEKMNLGKLAKVCGGVLVLGAACDVEDSGKMVSEVSAGDRKTEAEAIVKVSENTEITGAVLDSRQVTAGNLFFATVGERVDGHRFIGSVYEKGASCVVTQKTPRQVEAEHGIPGDSWGAYILVQDTLQALKDIAEYYRSTLKIPIVGITGSVGKTSTKEYIAGVLAQKYQVLKTEGNFNNEIGVPLTLLRIRKEHEAAVVEMGISDFGEMHRLSKMVRPTVCVITNIGQCHLENLGTRDGILKAKSEIFDFMQEDGEVCLNGDDDKLASVGQVKGKPVHYFGLGDNPNEEVVAMDIVSKGLFGSEAQLCLEGEKALPITVTQPGIHMVANAAAAACVGRILGLNREQITEGIRNVQPVSGRSNLISLPEYTLIDDCYNANPVSMRAAIDLLAMADTKKVAILGDMFELGADSDIMHEQTGEYAALAGLDCIICIGENAKHLYQGALRQSRKMIQAGCITTKIYHFDTREAFGDALEEKKKTYLESGSTILIKASHGMGFSWIVEKLQK